MVERRAEMKTYSDVMSSTCDKWDAYTSRVGLLQDDSGI